VIFVRTKHSGTIFRGDIPLNPTHRSDARNNPCTDERCAAFSRPENFIAFLHPSCTSDKSFVGGGVLGSSCTSGSRRIGFQSHRLVDRSPSVYPRSREHPQFCQVKQNDTISWCHCPAFERPRQFRQCLRFRIAVHIHVFLLVLGTSPCSRRFCKFCWWGDFESMLSIQQVCGTM
jgi:hypothetical protein